MLKLNKENNNLHKEIKSFDVQADIPGKKRERIKFALV